jgi:hypothetical protein
MPLVPVNGLTKALDAWRAYAVLGFYVVHLEGLAALFGGNRIALSPSARYGKSQSKVAT